MLTSGFLPLNHVWLFITDQCNLRCGYCFFKHKTGLQVMPSHVFRAALALCSPKGEFIFSGGEPLVVWDRLASMISTVRRRFPGRYVSVQTNATLMDACRAESLACWRVNVEVGIDGDEKTTLTNRPGSGVCYEHVLSGIAAALRSGGHCTATMTVHPSGVLPLEKNVMSLVALGLSSIEVHPAFLETWDRRCAEIFLRQYRRITAWEFKAGHAGAVGRGYSCPTRGVWDMVVLPNGKVLPNWVFLSFPEKVRAQFYVMDLSSGKARVLPFYEQYSKTLLAFLRKERVVPSYRRLSNFNAQLAVRAPYGRSYAVRVARYIELCEAIEDIDRKVLRKIC